MRILCWKAALILSFMPFLFPAPSFGLTTGDMLRLKKAGIPEDVIVEMVESGYQDADKVLKLKETGFTDRSIAAIVRGEAKNNQGKERISFETSGKARIMWYLVQRGKPVLQNSKTIDEAKVYVIDDAGIKLEWQEKEGRGLLDAFKSKGFPPPFYWVMNKDDMVVPGNQGASFLLRSTTNHKGKPDSDGYHYWELYLEPQNVKILEHIKKCILESNPSP